MLIQELMSKSLEVLVSMFFNLWKELGLLFLLLLLCLYAKMSFWQSLLLASYSDMRVVLIISSNSHKKAKPISQKYSFKPDKY